MPAAYYNEFDNFAADWLENLIREKLIPHGYVDRRSIADVAASDLAGFTQCHFFAGIGGWAYAARLAGWPDTLPIWTGSPPCQPFSVAGKQRGTADERHLWPEQFRLIRAARPARWFGEQVAGKAGLAWLDGVLDDLEGSDYAARPFVIPACGVDAPHRRERLWIVAEAMGDGDGDGCETGRGAKQTARHGHPVDAGSRERGGGVADTAALAQRTANKENGPVTREGSRVGARGLGSRNSTDAGGTGAVGDAAREQRALWQGEPSDARKEQPTATGAGNSFWHGAEWLHCADGKRRRVKPGLRLLADGLPRDVAGSLAGYGNAIVPHVAAQILAAYLETR